MFSKSTRPRGYQYWCNPCQAVRAKNNRELNPEAQKIADKKWWDTHGKEYSETHKEQMHVYQAKYRANNIQKCRDASTKHRNENREIINAKLAELRKTEKMKIYMYHNCRKYQTSKINAVPKWAASEFEKFAISEIYDLAYRRTKSTGLEWHVDHIVPLRSKRVCGLHCSANMQVIPSVENRIKGNRVWPNM